MFGARTKTKSRKTNVLTADPNAKPVSAALRFRLFPQTQRVFLSSSRVTRRAPANNHSPCRSKVHWRATTEAPQRHTSTPQGQFAKTNQEQMKEHNNRHTESKTASHQKVPQPSWFKSTWPRSDQGAKTSTKAQGQSENRPNEETNEKQMKAHLHCHTESDTASPSPPPQPLPFKSTWPRSDQGATSRQKGTTPVQMPTSCGNKRRGNKGA